MALRRTASPLTVYDAVNASLSDESVPQPDLAIGDRGVDGPLPLADFMLAVEVADSSQENDLKRKAPLYARHGVPEYWVVSRKDRCVYQFWQPTADGYARDAKTALGGTLASHTIEGLSVVVPVIE